MGLKRENYEVKEFGVVLPTAYAVIKNLYVSGNNISANIAVQTSRDNAFSLSPYKTVSVEIENADRNRNPYEVVYEYVKGEEVYFDQRAQREIRIPRAFNGWEDDIV